MTIDGLVGMIGATFNYFQALGDWHKDPQGVAAVEAVRDRMIRDLEAFSEPPSKQERAALCREWRASRIALEGDATYPPDMFIESVCQVVEIS